MDEIIQIKGCKKSSIYSALRRDAGYRKNDVDMPSDPEYITYFSEKWHNMQAMFEKVRSYGKEKKEKKRSPAF